MNRIVKSILTVALAAGLAVAGSAPAFALGVGGGASINGGIGCCRATQ
jgi:hypothetical protein